MANNECDRAEAIEYLTGNAQSGSYENDIALMLAGNAFGREYFTGDGIKDLFAFVTKQGLTLADEYNGMIY